MRIMKSQDKKKGRSKSSPGNGVIVRKMGCSTSLLIANKRRPLLIVKDARGARLREVAVQTLHNPEQAQNSERKRAPVDEATRTLVREDGEESPCDGNGARKVTLRRGEGICGGGRLEEEEAEEDKDLGPDACPVGERIDAECLKKRQNDQNSGPALEEIVI